MRGSDPIDGDEQIYYFDDPAVASAKKPWLPRLLSVSLLAMVGIIGTTFAANISLNSSKPIEFGQGVSMLTSCDSDVTFTPYSAFSSSSNTFYLSSFKITNLDSTSSGCLSRNFVVNIYSSTPGSASIGLYTISNNGSSFSSSDGTVETNGNGTTSTSVTLTLTSATISAAVSSTFTLETSLASCATGGSCSVGSIGPGGGIVFYAPVSAFTETGTACASSCRYLEAAPADWFQSFGIGKMDGGSLVAGTQVGDPRIKWGVSGKTSTLVGTSAIIGAGYNNTQKILAFMGTYNASTASYDAGAAAAYRGAGKSDWFLPSLNELVLLGNNAVRLGLTINATYQASSEYNATNNANMIVAPTTYTVGTSSYAKTWHDFVRPIRAF